jgi:hypothetical protein
MAFAGLLAGAVAEGTTASRINPFRAIVALADSSPPQRMDLL